jgi:hypothetical protein
MSPSHRVVARVDAHVAQALQLLSLVCGAQHATTQWVLRAMGQREGRTLVGGEQMVHAERVDQPGPRNGGRGRRGGRLETRLGGRRAKRLGWAGVNTAELFTIVSQDNFSTS